MASRRRSVRFGPMADTSGLSMLAELLEGCAGNRAAMPDDRSRMVDIEDAAIAGISATLRPWHRLSCHGIQDWSGNKDLDVAWRVETRNASSGLSPAMARQERFVFMIGVGRQLCGSCLRCDTAHASGTATCHHSRAAQSAAPSTRACLFARQSRRLALPAAHPARFFICRPAHLVSQDCVVAQHCDRMITASLGIYCRYLRLQRPRLFGGAVFHYRRAGLDLLRASEPAIAQPLSQEHRDQRGGGFGLPASGVAVPWVLSDVERRSASRPVRSPARRKFIRNRAMVRAASSRPSALRAGPAGKEGR